MPPTIAANNGNRPTIGSPLKIRIPKNDNNGNNANAYSSDEVEGIIYDIEFAAYEYIGALNENDIDKANPFRNQMLELLEEFNVSIKDENKNYRNGATKHIDMIMEQVMQAIEDYKERVKKANNSNNSNKSRKNKNRKNKTRKNK